jgi:hypothetical protein
MGREERRGEGGEEEKIVSFSSFPVSSKILMAPRQKFQFELNV